jgi:hypothetical protein
MSNLDRALSYLERGISIVPQIPGDKRPPIAWKEYQLNRAPEEVVRSWYFIWPNAGIAAVLGPISDLLVVDVDGPEAHQALVDRLGAVPKAPTAISGSGKPYRYHLFFRHPNVQTGAKATPWHIGLEFRGQGGLVVLPPSLHASGNRYQWAAGLSLDDLAPPEVPITILKALQMGARRKRAHRMVSVAGGTIDVPHIAGIAFTTQQFLRGLFAAGPNWNSRMFAAACDLCGNGVPLEEAMPLLLAGAKPVDITEEENVRRTIESAYAQDRVPGRALGGQEEPEEPVATWQIGQITVNEIKHPGKRHLTPASRVII